MNTTNEILTVARQELADLVAAGATHGGKFNSITMRARRNLEANGMSRVEAIDTTAVIRDAANAAHRKARVAS